MQFSPILLIASLAPLPAATFGDLDCITIKSCGNSGCGPLTEPFAVTFDWAGDAAIVTVNGTDHRLPWVATDTTTDDLGTFIEYSDMEDTNRLLRIETVGADITALYTFRGPRVTTWDATCNVRQAA